MRVSCRLSGCAVLVLALALSGAMAVQEPGRSAEDARIESFLSEAEVGEKVTIDHGITKPFRVTLRRGDETRWAVFKTVNVEINDRARQSFPFEQTFSDKYHYEVAAYRLDRLIGLGMVPPTIIREIEGEAGSLQIWVEGSKMWTRAAEEGFQPADPAAFEAQRAALYVFESLVANVDLTPRNILVTPADGRLWLIDHGRAFRGSSRPPDVGLGKRVPVPDWLVPRLEALDRDTLEAELSEVLDRKQIRAILKRRDFLLKNNER